MKRTDCQFYVGDEDCHKCGIFGLLFDCSICDGEGNINPAEAVTEEQKKFIKIVAARHEITRPQVVNVLEEMASGKGCSLSMRTLIALEFAIDILKDEKKVPEFTFVAVDGDEETNFDVWKCPRCSSVIDNERDGGKKVGTFLRERCRWCGQIIDWRNATAHE